MLAAGTLLIATFLAAPAHAQAIAVDVDDPAIDDVAVESAVPAAELNTDVIDFGDVEVGDRAEEVLVVASTGSQPLAVRQATLGGADAFELDDGCGGARLQPGDSCEIVVAYAPTEQGQHAAEVVVTTNAPDGPMVADLMGFAVPALVEVPDLWGLTLDDAAAAFEDGVLEFEPRLDGAAEGATVTDQDPAPGTLVEPGTVVQASLATTPGEPPGDSPDLLLPGLVLVAGAALTWAGVRTARSRSQRRWVRAHVRAIPRPGAAAAPHVEAVDGEGSRRGLAVSVVARPDPGTQTLEEVDA